MVLAPHIKVEQLSVQSIEKARQAYRETDLRERLATASLGGPERSRERHVARGKLLPRERDLRPALRENRLPVAHFLERILCAHRFDLVVVEARRVNFLDHAAAIVFSDGRLGHLFGNHIGID